MIFQSYQPPAYIYKQMDMTDNEKWNEIYIGANIWFVYFSNGCTCRQKHKLFFMLDAYILHIFYFLHLIWNVWHFNFCKLFQYQSFEINSEITISNEISIQLKRNFLQPFFLIFTSIVSKSFCFVGLLRYFLLNELIVPLSIKIRKWGKCMTW